MAKNRKVPSILALMDALTSARDPETALPPSRVYQADILWVDGKPTLTRSPVRISSAPNIRMQELLEISLDLPYSGEDKSLEGLTMGEALIVSMAKQAAEGDATARREILDRVLGQSVQKTQNLNLTGDLNSFLDHVSERTRTSTITITPEEMPVNADLSDL